MWKGGRVEGSTRRRWRLYLQNNLLLASLRDVHLSCMQHDTNIIELERSAIRTTQPLAVSKTISPMGFPTGKPCSHNFQEPRPDTSTTTHRFTQRNPLARLAAQEAKTVCMLCNPSYIRERLEVHGGFLLSPIVFVSLNKSVDNRYLFRAVATESPFPIIMRSGCNQR